MKKINGITLIEAFKNHPRSISKYARDMAALHLDIGKAHCNDLPCNKERLLSGITRQSVLSKEISDMAAKELKNLNPGTTVCHYDFHPDNIMTDGSQYWIIDWSNSSSGLFVADVMRTYMILSHAADPNGRLSSIISKTAGHIVGKTYIKHLLKLSGIDMDDMLSWEIPTIAARFSEDVPKGEKASLLRRLNKILV